MKIAIFDPYMPKFTNDMMDWWQNAGHEVRRDRYYDPVLVDWADIIWFETCDHNLEVASHGLPDHPDWPLSQRKIEGKKVIVRVIDIEAWYGHHLNADWNMIDDVIFVAPHIKELVEKDIDFAQTNTRTHVIPCGVNLDKFPLSLKPKTGKKIAWVCEKWPTKGIDYALQLMAALPKDYELHALGRWNDRYAWEKAYQEDFIARNGIKFYDYEWFDDVNDFLADKDFILSCSKKEAFGYNIAEGMATGMVPLIHRFYGCDALWDVNVWDRIDEAAYIIQTYSDDRYPSYPKIQFRKYLKKRGYTVPVMMGKFDEVLLGEVSHA